MPRTAILAGATGLVGGQVLDVLLSTAAFTRVHVLARRPFDVSHEKLSVHVVDFDKLEVDLPEIHDVFVCLGTTIKVAGSQEKFRKVDYDYAIAVARLGRERGAKRCALVSSVGASSSASSFYLRVKGQTEQAFEGLRYATLIVARPSFLMGQRVEKRTGERIGIGVARALSFALVGSLRTYRPIEARSVAEAIVIAMEAGAPGTRFIDHDAIVLLAGSRR